MVLQKENPSPFQNKNKIKTNKNTKQNKKNMHIQTQMNTEHVEKSNQGCESLKLFL